ncbi:hypothetical protein BDW02DRAFT_616134 [Decorospora gaudefroyi]|uniref:t-SNARE coiled-coil homology domain-containing protein n=1 Tax=Decorospora gaudefroyi TaxID=184978 RepID=A0A6A5K4T4_9PLEO|nr:hypothetical protein BDW02DRAFT_616134 [Decorospora gaudefroyi]
MSNRFARQDPTPNDLFSTYNRSASPSKTKNKNSPHSTQYGYGLAPAFGAYPGSGSGYGISNGSSSRDESNRIYRSATPNSRGQYSAAVLDELESQNEDQVGVLSGKVAMLKQLTHLIGDEIRDSTSLTEKMNDQFESSRLKVRGTMNRMLSMAKKTGVGWRVWVGFFAAVFLLFWWVWLR